jgi:hypothetical protein
MSPKMKRHWDSLSREIEKASLDLKQESDRQHSRGHPSPIGKLPSSSYWLRDRSDLLSGTSQVNSPQSEPAFGNFTLEEEMRILSPRMKNYLKRLGDNQEGTLADDFEKFYQVGFSSGMSHFPSVLASLIIGALHKVITTPM